MKGPYVVIVGVLTLLAGNLTSLWFSHAVLARPGKEVNMGGDMADGAAGYGEGGETIQLQKLLRWDEHPEIREAVMDAAQRVEKRRKCLGLFGPGAVDALKSANYRLVPAGPPKQQASPGMKYALVNAMTLREQKLIMINSEGVFMKPRMTLFGAHFNYGLRGNVEVRSFLLLHELGHLTARFQPDAHDAELGRKYSDLVLKACFQ